MGLFILAILQGLITLIIWAIIISAILSWLIAFEVINLRNRFVYNVHNVLERVTYPILAPARRVIPPLGGVDLSPIVVILVLQAANQYLLPWIFRPIIAALGG